MNIKATGNNRPRISLTQFNSATNLDVDQTEARAVVDRMNTSMNELACLDGEKGVDKDNTEGRVLTESSYRWSSFDGPRRLTTKSLEFDPKTKSFESYKHNSAMESPYGDTMLISDSFSVDGAGREHYVSTRSFNGSSQNSHIVIDRSGNIVQFGPDDPQAVNERPGAPMSLRSPDLESIKVSPELAASQTLTFMNEPAEVGDFFQALMGDKEVRLATAGYSAPPEGYLEPTTRFLTSLAKALKNDLGLVTSPTADKGSIDAITSTVGQREGAPIGYITADAYLSYVNPENFPEDLDKQQFAKKPKFAFPDAEVYSRATAELSNSFLVTGGRNASVSDFKNAIKSGNRVVLLNNSEVKSPSWDPQKGRVDNASSYLSKMIAGDNDGIPMNIPFNQDIAVFLKENKELIAKLVLSVDASDPGAIQEAASHFRRRCGNEER